MKATLPTISDEKTALNYLNGQVGYCLAQQVRPATAHFNTQMDRHCRWSEAEDAICAGRKAVEFFRSAGYLSVRLSEIYAAIFDKIEAEFGSYDEYCEQEKARAV